MDTQIESLIIGGGQGGLAVSYFLKQDGREHIVLEAATQAGNAWRNDRWDSFTLVTPNWSFRLPGAEYNGDEPDGYMPRHEIVATFESYVEQYRLPVQYGVRAKSVELHNSSYRVETDKGTYLARHVVIATGLFQTPKIPTFSEELNPDILQLPSGKYRHPGALPPGAVLVVGSAQSGCQIAEELDQSGRKVYLCVGSAGRAPRCYRGRDLYEWVHLNGFLARTTAQLPSPRARFAGNPQLSGKNGGHSLNLHQFYRDGVVLLGRLQDIQGDNLILAPDLQENLHKVDKFELNLLSMIDNYILQSGIDAPSEHIPVLEDAYQSPEITRLDLEAAGISTVIWALGYNFDFSLVKLPILDSYGFPQSTHGETTYPGLYFAGLPWLPGQKTGLLLGVAENAAYIANKITA